MVWLKRSVGDRPSAQLNTQTYLMSKWKLHGLPVGVLKDLLEVMLL
jgi:hypothetical protein